MKTKAQREVIEKQLQELADSNGGRLTPYIVIEDARHKDSPLHGEFEWDVKKAAAAHWIKQARDLIASVTIVIHTTRVDIRSPAYIRDPNCASHEQGYIEVARLRTDSDASREALIAEFSRVGDLLRRARILAVALDMENDVRRIIDGVMELRERLQTPPPSVM